MRGASIPVGVGFRVVVTLYIMLPMNAAADNPVARSGPRAQPFQAPQGDLAVLPGSGNPILAQAIADGLSVPLVPCHAHVFSEGNVFVPGTRGAVRGYGFLEVRRGMCA